jgi:hypothetical protein
MAREVAAWFVDSPPVRWKRNAERRAARRRAAASADGAIARLTRQLEEMRAAAVVLGAPGVAARLQAAAPALASLCHGVPVAPADRLQRNVALHAAQLPGPGAPMAAWRAAQRGPRLGTVCRKKVRFAMDLVDIIEFTVHETSRLPTRVARDGCSYTREQFRGHYGPLWESHWHASAGEAFFVPQATLDSIFRLLKAKMKDKVLLRKVLVEGLEGAGTVGVRESMVPVDLSAVTNDFPGIEALIGQLGIVAAAEAFVCARSTFVARAQVDVCVAAPVSLQPSQWHAALLGRVTATASTVAPAQGVFAALPSEVPPPGSPAVLAQQRLFPTEAGAAMFQTFVELRTSRSGLGARIAVLEGLLLQQRERLLGGQACGPGLGVSTRVEDNGERRLGVRALAGCPDGAGPPAATTKLAARGEEQVRPLQQATNLLAVADAVVERLAAFEAMANVASSKAHDGAAFIPAGGSRSELRQRPLQARGYAPIERHGEREYETTCTGASLLAAGCYEVVAHDTDYGFVVLAGTRRPRLEHGTSALRFFHQATVPATTQATSTAAQPAGPCAQRPAAELAAERMAAFRAVYDRARLVHSLSVP